MNYPFSKKAIATLMMAAMVTTSAQAVVAAANATAVSQQAAAGQAPIHIEINDKQVFAPDAAPYIDAATKRTMVPVRFVSESLGAKVDWNGEKQTVTVTRDNRTFTLTINQQTADVAGKQVALDAKPVIKNGRTYVPLRFVGESIGAKVEWDDKDRLISIHTDSKGSTTATADSSNAASKENTSTTTATDSKNTSTTTGSSSATDSAQADKNLTLDEAIKMALENNSDLNSLRIDAKNADLNARLVNATVHDIPAKLIESLSQAQQKYVNNAKAQVAKKVNALAVKTTEHKIELGAQKAYYDLLNAEADLKLKQQGVERAAQQKKVAEAAFKVGTKAKTDVLQADAALSGAQAALAVAENSVKITHMKLNSFIGADLNAEWNLTPGALNIDDLGMGLKEAIDLAVTQRAEVQQKQEELKVAELNTKLIAEYSALSTWQGQMSQNDEEKAKIAIESTKNSISVEVSQAYYNLQSAKAALDANQKAVDSAKENYRLTNLRYQNGMGTTLEVIQAGEELSNRENQLQNAVYNYNLAVVTFRNSLGN